MSLAGKNCLLQVLNQYLSRAFDLPCLEAEDGGMTTLSVGSLSSLYYGIHWEGEYEVQAGPEKFYEASVHPVQLYPKPETLKPQPTWAACSG